MSIQYSTNGAQTVPDNETAEGVRPTPPAIDPFDPVNVRIDQGFMERGAAKKLLTVVPVGKPHKQDYVRVHPSPDYRVTVALIELEDDRNMYLVAPGLAQQLNEGTFFLATLYLTINRQKVPRLWPVKLPRADGRQNTWHTSAAEAAELAMTNWINVASNMALGAYDIRQAAVTVGEPEWPDLPFNEILRIAFKGRLIDSLDHPVMQRLRGEL